MAVLNDWNEQTKKNMHLMVTVKCDRKCPFCCNNSYSLEDILVASEEELSEVENLFITGGEPFAYSNPNLIAKYYKDNYPNIKKVYVYTNMFEFFNSQDTDLCNIDGINFSIKNQKDYKTYLNNRKKLEEKLKEQKVVENRIYCFPGFNDIEYSEELFTKFNRVWQKEFQAASDSFFRKLEDIE